MRADSRKAAPLERHTACLSAAMPRQPPGHTTCPLIRLSNLGLLRPFREETAVAPRLAEAGYRVLALDSRGHGQTRVSDYDFGINQKGWYDVGCNVGSGSRVGGSLLLVVEP